MRWFGWTLVSFVREHAKGEASHRGHGGHRGRVGWWTNALGSTSLAQVREHAQGESIAQRSRRPQRGIRVGGRMHLGQDRWLPVREHAQRGKHRTEVTEVTEGDLGWWTNALGSRSLAHVREHAQRGKHRTEVHGGHRAHEDRCRRATPLTLALAGFTSDGQPPRWH